MKRQDNKIQVKKKHYFNLNYDKKARWISYWYQIHEVISQNPKTVLEIGVGNNTVSDYLKKIGLKVTTCDFDKNLNPDVCASVLKLPFKDNSFDMVLCAEVLEHTSYSDFTKALSELYRVSKNKVIITLPHSSLTNLYFGIKLIPFIPKKEIMLKIDWPFDHHYDGEHYWEIGKKGYSFNIVKNDILKTGFKIRKTFFSKENPYHQFFILFKK